MKEIETDRMVDTVEQVPSIQKGHEGETARVEVAPCPTGDGPKESGRAAPAGKEEVRGGPELDSNLFQAWDDAVDELGQTRPPDPAGSFEPWFGDGGEMYRLSRALCVVWEAYKGCQFRHIIGNGFCSLGVLSVNTEGLVLGIKYGDQDDCSRSVTWNTRFVPKSLLMDETLNDDQLGDRILDLPSTNTADLSESNGVEEETIDYNEPDDGAEDEYMGGRCAGHYATGEKAI